MTAWLRLTRLGAALLALGCIAADEVAKATPKGRWMLGKGGESCDQVCHGTGGACVDSAWPMSAEQFGDIAASLGYECRDLRSGGAAYDPSASDFSCGWQGYVARPRVQLTQCSATPPLFAIRFCPCMEGGAAPAGPAPTEAEVTFDCNEGFAEWERSWADNKKQFCCEQKGRGCPTMTTKAFDCAAGFKNFEAGWSPQKRAWCCENEQLGCAYDCDAGFKLWQTGWSEEKKQYCCEHEHKGCAFDCDAGFSKWQTGWSEEKKQYCCEHEHKGCAYDCDAGFKLWKTGWSEEKKQYCCEHEHKGCSEQTYPSNDQMYGFGVDAPQRRLHV